MDVEDLVSFMMTFVQKHNCPLVHDICSEDSYAIFNVNNRWFLMSWALNLLNEQYFEPLIKSQDESNKLLIADVLSCYGFCNKEDGLLFMSGKLLPEKEIYIAYNLFNFIERLGTFDIESDRETNSNIVEIEDQQESETLKMNLFPLYAQVKPWSKDEKKLKLNEMQNKLNAKNKLNVDNRVEENINLHDSNKVQEVIGSINERLNEFKEISQEIVRNDEISIAKAQYVFDSQFGDVLNKSNNCLNIVTQYTEDLKVIDEFHTELVDINASNSDISSLIDCLATLSNTVIGK
ncbi:putative leucine-rich repeat-containing protein DDB_G0290503 [Euwallacea similis]|uniref:putative leucine-rich repeat-containing protein DDB_G0290503 n=1 Tax=Euwallacea similis TaxID=1736056 RepID=UPI00344DB8DE